MKPGTAFHWKKGGGSLPTDRTVGVGIAESDLDLIMRHFDLSKITKKQALHDIICFWYKRINETISS